MTRKIHVKTYGCQMNVYDSVKMADVMAPHGYAESPSADGSDLIILNTCHIREKATEKVYSELGRLRQLKAAAGRAGRRVLIGVAGCVAQAEGEEIIRRAPVVDLVFGPQSYHRLPELVSRALGRAPGAGGGIVDTDFPTEAKFDHLPEAGRDQGPAAYLSVQEGCDKFCAFCVVPYTRGAEFSRPVTSIIEEARRIVAGGALEITLLGQNVNAYHGEGPDGRVWGLGRLIRTLAEIVDLERLRYTTSHPRDMDDDLIAAHGDVTALMPYLHLPVQSGSDRVLETMNRRHSADDYRRLVDRLRTIRPDLALSSDFIVGFPGEGDRDFADTLRLVRDVGYAQAYSFKYSARPGTPAATVDDQVPDTVKAERLETLQQLLNAQQRAFNESAIGSVQAVLFERRGNKDGQLLGRGPWLQSVHADAPDRLLGALVDVRIDAAGANSLAGRVVTTDATGSTDHAAGPVAERVSA